MSDTLIEMKTEQFEKVSAAVKDFVLGIITMSEGFESKITTNYLDEDLYGTSGNGNAIINIDTRLDISGSIAVEGFEPTCFNAALNITFDDCVESLTDDGLVVAKVMPPMSLLPIQWCGNYTLNYGHYSNNIIWGLVDSDGTYDEGSTFGLSEKQDISLIKAVVSTFDSIPEKDFDAFLSCVFMESVIMRSAMASPVQD